MKKLDKAQLDQDTSNGQLETESTTKEAEAKIRTERKDIMRKINLVLSVGSVDGVCTSAAVLRNTDPNADLHFCQAFTVDKVDPSTWGDQRNVLFVDLAVNNRDEAMTVDFLRRVNKAGHTVRGVLDEHNADDWKKVFESAELPFNDLVIKPVSQDEGDIKSSGALLLSVLGDEEDEHTRELCEAADAGDRMDFSTYFGGTVNKAVKSRITDDSRRVHLAKHFAKKRDADDETIKKWIAEYDAILATHEEIIKERQDLGDGIVRISAVGKVVDMSTLMKTVYGLGYDIVITEGEKCYDKSIGAKVRQVAFGCKPGLNLDVVSTIKATGVECSGFAAKANVKPENEEIALATIRKALISLKPARASVE